MPSQGAEPNLPSGPDAGEINALVALFSADRHAEAEAVARQIIQSWPDHGFGWKVLGTVLAARQRFAEALPVILRSLALVPSDPETYNTLGFVQLALGRASEAEASHRRAVELKPDYHQAYNNLGNALQVMGRLSEAEESYRRVLELEPDDAMAHNNLANALHDLGRSSEGEASFRRALVLNPDSHLAYRNLGSLLQDLGRLSEAEANYRRALELNPDFAKAWQSLAAIKAYQSDFTEVKGLSDTALKMIVPGTRDGNTVWENRLYVLSYHPDLSAEEIFAEFVRWGDLQDCSGALRGHDNERDPNRRLRVGFVSPDFRRHTSRFYFEPLFEHHDRNAVELFAYSNVKVPDDYTGRFKKLFDHWRDIAPMSDDAAAELVRRDGIDILVDGCNHMRDERLGLFARKPAPAQVTWLGSAWTSGLPGMDYVLFDPHLAPEGTLAREAIIRLPRSFVPFRPRNDFAPAGQAPCVRNGYVTFGYFGRTERLNHRVFRVWGRILAALPQARLILDFRAFGDPATRDYFVGFLARHGVNVARVTLRHSADVAKALREVDIMFDSFPHCGGTMSYDAVCMGVPLLTLAARAPLGRIGAGIMNNLGLGEWVAADEQSYVDKAVAFAGDMKGLAELRRGMRERVASSAWRDEAGYARAVERAYREMWRRWCTGAAAGPLDIAPEGEAKAPGTERSAVSPRSGPDEGEINELVALFSANRYAEAETVARQMIETWPHSGAGWKILGTVLAACGRFDEAVPDLRKALELSPLDREAHNGLGVAMLALGRSSEAESIHRRAVELEPDHHETHSNLGNALQVMGRLSEAEQSYRRALELKPDYPMAYYGLASALQALGRLSEAEAGYRRALELRPAYAEAHNNLGNVLIALGRIPEAEASYRAALALKPENCESHFNLGVALQAAGRLSDAEASFRRVVHLSPGYFEGHNNLGNILLLMGRPSDAEKSLCRALELRPDSHATHNSLAMALQALGRLSEAESSCRRALALKPGYHEAHNNLGNVLRELGRLSEAEASFRRALEINPEMLVAHNNLGIALKDLGRLEEAEESFRDALELSPDYGAAHNNLGNVLRLFGQVEEAEASYRRAVELKRVYSLAHSNVLFTLNYTAKLSRAELFEEHLAWARRHEAPHAPERQPHANARDPHRRLRVGYVSPDFRRHSVAFFIEPVLARHDRGALEVYCYSNVVNPDSTTHRLMGLADCARSIFGMGDADAAELVRSDGIDILVDLAGHTANGRLGLFALKPAPVQVAYLGYPNTTGLSAIDWRLTDAHADPPGEGDAYYSERPVRLPETFLCYQPPAQAPAVQPPPVLEIGRVTFGSFNVLAKVTPEVIGAWAQLLQRVPGSRLMIKALGLGDSRGRGYMLGEFGKHGISGERVILLAKDAGHRAHLARYHEVDIALDPFPYNGTTTTFDALWMGVPVVSLAGGRHAARVGASILANLGLEELIAHSVEEYLGLAAGLAMDRARLARLRETMRARMCASPVLDGARLTRHVEAAYREMWRRWCADAPAAAFDVAAG